MLKEAQFLGLVRKVRVCLFVCLKLAVWEGEREKFWEDCDSFMTPKYRCSPCSPYLSPFFFFSLWTFLTWTRISSEPFFSCLLLPFSSILLKIFKVHASFTSLQQRHLLWKPEYIRTDRERPTKNAIYDTFPFSKLCHTPCYISGQSQSLWHKPESQKLSGRRVIWE